MTGYLTQARENEITDPLPDNMSALKIPNAEIREIFETTVEKWFLRVSKHGIERLCSMLHGVVRARSLHRK